MHNRILGVDIARAFAIFGMVFINFKMVLSNTNSRSFLSPILSFLEGKAAASFVILAGVGIALMTKKRSKEDRSVLQKINKNILKRAFWLFVIGTVFTFIWPADILHYYAFYMLVLVCFLDKTPRFIFNASIVITLLYPVTLLFFDYETGWNLITLSYENIWSIKGYARNLLWNGFHPVLPWSSFILIGYWLGLQDLQNLSLVKKLLKTSVVVAVLLHVCSFVMQNYVSFDVVAAALFTTQPMPALPLYMFTSSASAFILILTAIYLGRRFSNNKILLALQKTGQLSLTFYMLHIVFGMGFLQVYTPEAFGNYSLFFAVLYAIEFNAFCILFAFFWLKRYDTGPLEYLLKTIMSVL